jgi:hypothetical protein
MISYFNKYNLALLLLLCPLVIFIAAEAEAMSIIDHTVMVF